MNARAFPFDIAPGYPETINGTALRMVETQSLGKHNAQMSDRLTQAFLCDAAPGTPETITLKCSTDLRPSLRSDP